MKKFKNILGSDNKTKEEVAKKGSYSKMFKLLLITFLLCCINLMSSCEIWVPVGDDGHRHYEHHEHHEHHDQPSDADHGG